MQSDTESDYKLRTLRRSALAISSVILVELILGLLVNSLAIISDGLHALLDALTTFVLLIATKASLKPPDEEHMYGHEKFESIGGLVGGIALVSVAMLIIYEAIMKILGNQPINPDLGFVGFIAIGYTFCIDFFRVGTLFRAKDSESHTMKAGFYHAIADLSSTIIALVGFGLAFLGFRYGDSIASIILGSLLSYLSVKLVWSSGMELSDAVSKDLADKVRKEISGTKNVLKCEDLKIRKAGDKTFVRATVQVPDYLGHEEAHDLASEVEEKIKKALGNVDVSIHTEPRETGIPTEKLVEKLAMEVSGVREAHEVTAAYTDGKLYITLHALVDSRLPIVRAHEIAEQVEDKIEENIKDIANVTVHVEPTAARERKGPMVHEDEIRKIISETAGTTQAYRIKEILTYVADKKRYINIVCLFSKQTSIEDAHKIASEIEEKVKVHFAETIVTVHMETE